MASTSDESGDRTPLRVGVATTGVAQTLDDRRRDLRSMADAGIDHLFMADHVSFRGGAGIDGVTHLAVAAGLEERLGLYLGVMLLALRHPVVAARQITELALAAPGRVTIGVGVGGEDRHEFEVCGVDPRTRGRRTDACLEIVRALLAGDEVDRDDEFFTIEAATIRPTVQPDLPFTVGGRSDAALARAGRYGDGWLASWCSPRRFAEGTARAEEIGAACGRAPLWQHGLQVWVGVGDSVEAGRAHVAGEMEAFYRIPFDGFAKYTPVGTAEDIAEFLAPYVESGAAVLNLTPCGPDRDTEIATIAAVKRMLVGAA